MDVARSRGVQRVWRNRLASLIIAGFAFALCQPLKSMAFEMDHAEVTEDKGVFRLQFTTTIDAPAEYVRKVITDYRHIYRLNSSIIESEVLPKKRSDETTIRTKLLACLSVFCREIERVDIMRVLASGDLQADIVPELSEFRSGQAIWKVTALDNKSRLVYEATLEPDFFIPPVIGISVISNRLKNEFMSTFDRIERIANINAKRDWGDDFAFASLETSEPGPPCE